MKNGYYLSCYIEFDPLGNIYYYARRHDQNIALWKVENQTIQLIHYWELERLTGIKKHQVAFYDVNEFYTIMNELLIPFHITLADIIEIYGTPELNHSNEYAALSKYPNYTYHTMCHLATCLFMETDLYKNQKILAFSVDGGSDIIVDTDAMEKKQFVGCYSDQKAKRMELFPVVSPGEIWDYISSRYKMQEGSLMALSSASDSIVYYNIDDEFVEAYINAGEKGYFYINKLIDYVDLITNDDKGIKFNYFDKRFTETENKISMVMKLVQKLSFDLMKKNIDHAVVTYHLKPEEVYLAMSGGFALNCPCNTQLMEEYHFKGFIAPPCVSDSGMALGIGLYAFHETFTENFNFSLKSAYYGDRDNLDQLLMNQKYREYIKDISEFKEDTVVDDIIHGPIVWFWGQAEIGPRALGGRSIIGDPRTKQTKDVLNHIKQRQWWRPVAPIVLKEKMEEWFEESYESPYMLHAFHVRKEKQNEVVAITHIDGTARIQSMDETTPNALYQVLKAFDQRTGVPILCNTSLNDKGEPIINKTAEAINFALRKEIHVIYINGKRVELVNHAQYKENKPLKRDLKIEMWKTEDEFENYVDLCNPYHVPTNVLFYYIYFKLNDLSLLQRKEEIRKIQLKSRIFINSLSPFIQADIEKYCNMKYMSEETV